ncbi:hypothetical protein E6C60_3051 [Paenibacillus algicola]|uniref:Uncharacterized protein n=1 Tax=Paenibacillus algicola TaxID=2565926 RepID=A0A4P8XLW2_9BACL|nr:hypothetical protein [Paenibacillus algicola]QCT03762.1 hypothetical protein E6C60_3051 [Paenibacillus algicola]
MNDMSHYFYITPDEYNQAQKNGVDPENLNRRVRLLGWKKDKAINTPLRKITDHKYWADVAEKNGITYYTFTSRINVYGWSEERAATEPLQDFGSMREAGTDAIRKIPRIVLMLAEQNKLKYHTVRMRIKKGWGLYEAATVPVATHSEAGKIGKQKTIDLYGDWNRFSFGAKRA